MINQPEDAQTPVTLWSRKNERGEYEHNHLDDGHCEAGTERPRPKTDAHKSAWNKGQWAYEHAWLDGGLPPRVMRDAAEHGRYLASRA